MSSLWLSWFLENASGFTGQALTDEPLSKHTYYRIGGPAPLLLIPKNKADLEWIKKGINKTQCDFYIIGAGSNLLVSDAGTDALVIKTSRLNLDIEEVSSKLIRVGASVAVSTLLRKAGLEGWSGLEFMTGIPGSVGGVVYMNAGTHLGEAKDHLNQVESLDLKITLPWVTHKSDAFRFDYRKNLFLSSTSVIFETLWNIEKKEPAEVKKIIDETLLRRKNSQPLDFPSCGSVFMNPKSSGLRAWEVIEKIGLRGHQIGSAQFSEKHPNFIINLGNATAADVRALIDLAKEKALSLLSIHLQEEVKYLGRRRC